MGGPANTIEQSLHDAVAGHADVVRHEDGAWRILTGADIISVELDEQARRVCFSMEYLGEMPELPREKLVMLMQYSFLWNVTDGLYFALNDEERPIMMVAFPVSEIDASFVRSVVFGMVQKFSVWKEIISDGQLGG